MNALDKLINDEDEIWTNLFHFGEDGMRMCWRDKSINGKFLKDAIRAEIDERVTAYIEKIVKSLAGG